MTRLTALLRIAAQLKRGQAGSALIETNVGRGALAQGRLTGWAAWSGFHSSASKLQHPPASADPTELATEIEHATGLEREELESTLKGVDRWHESWLDAPFGTADNPVAVPSEFDHRVVGVPDPDDDSLVWWGIIEDGQPPKQIIDDGEYFVLKRLPSSGGHH